MPRILTLDAALATCSAGLVEQDRLIAALTERDSAALPLLAQRLVAAHPPPDLVAVTVGPGSFTGLRAAIALAHGIAIGLGIELVGVTIGAALGETPGRTLWTAIDTKRGSIFLERDGQAISLSLDHLPDPTDPIAVAGDAAIQVASRLAAKGFNVRLLDDRAATPIGIARAAAAGMTRPPLPLYIDPPHAKPGPPGRPPPA